MPLNLETPVEALPGQHVSVLHGPARTGRVSVSTAWPWKERMIPVEDLHQYLRFLPLDTNVYLSQARFHGRRRIVNLAHVNAAWVDIDCYKPHPTWNTKTALWAVLKNCEQADVPPPSYVLGSGRGLAAIWLTEVLPRRALPRWRAVQAALIDALRPVGADSAARDVARVLRLAGSTNTKPSPPRQVCCIYPEVGSPTLYAFNELAEWVLPYDRPERPAPGNSRTYRHSVRHPGRSPGQLWTDRLNDLQRLRSLRWFGELPSGHRDIWLFIASCALSWIAPLSVVGREVRELARQAIGGAWSQRLVENHMGAVLRRAEQAGRGQTITYRGQPIDPRYRFKSAIILNWLGITREEQTEMRTLIGPEERARRRSIHQAENGRRGGKIRRGRTAERDVGIIAAVEAGESMRSIERRLGLAHGAVRYILKRGGE